VKKDRPMMHSESAWLRGNGWVAASLAEMLEIAPRNHPARPAIEAILRRLLHGALRHQNPNALWDTVMSDPGFAYQEASGSALLAYGIAKSVNLGVLPPELMASARDTFLALAAILERREGGLSLPQISGDTMPYRKLGYRLIPRKRDLPFGVGALALLAAELERGAR
jgi:rhamnogalacturonyl hydrolase YesR